MIRRLKFTIEGFYEVADTLLEQGYGDPEIDAEGIARIDQANYDKMRVSVEDLISWCDEDEIKVKIEAVTPVEAHDHGHGPGQHVHEGWVPDRVIARMKRDGLCGHQTPRDGGMDVCMTLAKHCTEHRSDCGLQGCTETLPHTHPTL